MGSVESIRLWNLHEGSMKTHVIQILTVLVYVERSYQIYVTSEHDEQDIEEHLLYQKKPVIPIIKQNFEQDSKGYRFSYETADGILAEETGFIKNPGDEKHETIVKQGSVTYMDEHGKPITLTYVADEHGFQPQGDHLPTPPPVPEEIRKALEYQQVHEEKPEYEQYQGEYQEQEQFQQEEYGHHQIQRRH